MDPISKQHFNTLCLTVSDGRMQNMYVREEKDKIYFSFSSGRHGGGGGGGI